MRAPTLLLALSLCACSIASAGPDGELFADGGRGADVDAGCDDLFGPCDAAGINAPVSDADIAACENLVAKTCGVEGGPRCDAAPSCTAANLLSAHEPTECATALANETSYPPCTASPCATLVEKVCGAPPESAGTCSDAPGCAPSVQLYDRSVDAESSAADREDAIASCSDALEDDTVFIACGA